MENLKKVLNDVKIKVANVDPTMEQNVNEMVNYLDSSPQIETFAKPKAKVSLVDDSGVVHSFAVEIKSNQDGPIPDTQLMSKILQAIESHNGASGDVSEFASGTAPMFEVVSFKYERRDDKKK